MDCEFLKVGSNDPCHKQAVKNSKYCAMHKFLMKNGNVKSCLRCGKRTCSKLQICNKCGANKIRVLQRYHNVVKPFYIECRRLRNIKY